MPSPPAIRLFAAVVLASALVFSIRPGIGFAQGTGALSAESRQLIGDQTYDLQSDQWSGSKESGSAHKGAIDLSLSVETNPPSQPAEEKTSYGKTGIDLMGYVLAAVGFALAGGAALLAGKTTTQSSRER
ncbi:hypothetical protein [uncultured Olegusella sp.]|uniref:hypothetical protein n=1 Tax=uncultured Olegusella sp. TaxID=1979846 RepID=UPI0026339A5A|nr:hypothetical protein [uncultured Olegusella sp.]